MGLLCKLYSAFQILLKIFLFWPAHRLLEIDWRRGILLGGGGQRPDQKEGAESDNSISEILKSKFTIFPFGERSNWRKSITELHEEGSPFSVHEPFHIWSRKEGVSSQGIYENEQGNLFRWYSSHLLTTQIQVI